MTAQLYITVMISTAIATTVSFSLISYQTQKRMYTQELDTGLDISCMAKIEKWVTDFYTENGLGRPATIQVIADLLMDLYKDTTDDISTLKYDTGTSLSKLAEQCGRLFILNHAIGIEGLDIDKAAIYAGDALRMPIDAVEDFIEKTGLQKARRKKHIDIICDMTLLFGVSRISALRRIKSVRDVKSYLKSSASTYCGG